jgi:hypothetical protein
MFKRVLVFFTVLALAALLPAMDIGGKVAIGFEQGVGMGADGQRLGYGLSIKKCLGEMVALKAAVGLNYSQKTEDFNDPMSPNPSDPNQLYTEDKDRIDYSLAAYGILVFRRFERVHINGMTGLLVVSRDNHFDKEISADEQNGSFTNSGEELKTLDVHFRVLLAPEIFIFPNFSIEYKYGLDIALKKDPFVVTATGDIDYLVERKRLHAAITGDLNLLQNASVHFYF